jgi:cytochrome bd-type quinol oxidase subunit 1
VVAVSGVLSAVFVVLANSWMNAPAGFDVVNGQPVNINLIAAMLNPALHLKLLLMASEQVRWFSCRHSFSSFKFSRGRNSG